MATESTIDFTKERVTYVIEIPVLNAEALDGARRAADQLGGMFGFVVTRVKREPQT